MKKIYFDVINSTQNYAKDRARLGFVNEIYIAKEQNAGVGRSGHVWESRFGGLWFSFITDEYNSIYTITLGIAIMKSLKELYNIDTKIKWPNDILLNNKKIAGIICEKISNFVVVGIGINTNFEKEQLGELVSGASTIKSELNIEINNEELLDKIIEKISVLQDTGEILRMFKSNMAYLNEKRYIGQINKEAIIKGIDNEGYLIVESEGEEYKIIGGTL